MRKTIRGQAWPGILHRDQHAIRFGLSGGDEQLPRPFRRRVHCLDSVHYEVEDNLLQLYAIAFDERQILPKCRLCRRAVLLRFATGELDYLTDHLVYVHSVLPWRRFFDELTDAADDVAGAIGVLDDTAERLPALL